MAGALWMVGDWGHILKALLKQVKGFDHFALESHYRILSGLMMGLVLFFRKIIWLEV